MNKSIIFVTGLSGAGRSEVMKALEDLDFFCVDNLPLALLSDLSKLSNTPKEPEQRVRSRVLEAPLLASCAERLALRSA